MYAIYYNTRDPTLYGALTVLVLRLELYSVGETYTIGKP